MNLPRLATTPVLEEPEIPDGEYLPDLNNFETLEDAEAWLRSEYGGTILHAALSRDVKRHFDESRQSGCRLVARGSFPI